MRLVSWRPSIAPLPNFGLEPPGKFRPARGSFTEGSPIGESRPAVGSTRRPVIFEAEFSGAALPVIKDPRICRFAPFWLEVLREMQKAPRIVIPIRSPLEVAQSLEKQQGVPLNEGLLLWLRHNLDAEE